MLNYQKALPQSVLFETVAVGIDGNTIEPLGSVRWGFTSFSSESQIVHKCSHIFSNYPSGTFYETIRAWNSDLDIPKTKQHNQIKEIHEITFALDSRFTEHIFATC